MQKEDRSFEGHHVRRCPFFCPKTSEDQKKKVIALQAVVCIETFQTFRGRMIFDMISLFMMRKRTTFGHFLASSEDKLFLVKEEDICPTKGGRMVTLLKSNIYLKFGGLKLKKVLYEVVRAEHMI